MSIFNRKVTIIYEIFPRDENDKTEDVKVFGIVNKWQDQALAELLIKNRGNYCLFVQSTKKEIKKLGFPKIFEKAEKERFEAVKEGLK
jgi:hypothetical protein